MIKKNISLLNCIIAAFVLVLVLNSSVFCADAQLKFSLILEKTEYAPDEPVKVIFTLKNLGATAVVVNQRFYISSQKVPGNQREVYFELTSPSGGKLPCQHFYETGYPKTDYFKLLAPGEEAKSEYPRDLKAYFDILEPGTYTAEAVYQNVFGAEIGLDVFSGQLVSEPVKFTIVKAKK
ncbi:MAG TPA: hypothetical protein PL125_05425 [Candidatus Omnitrophota bacterium]|nr:hypothetical protein [Candidatus Omnitrophota bacterium]HPT39615.1 hypothetical protein [Candidatus Omnitrophota bacterium]